MGAPLSELIKRLNGSQLVRHAAMLFGANLITRVLAFFGIAYAAKCLGPSNLGISALVQSVALAGATLAGAGLDNVVVRRIAADPTCARSISWRVVVFRFWVLSFVIPLAMVFAFSFARDHLFAWAMGMIVLAATSFSSTFVFQALEKLPIQALLSVLTGILAAIAYFGLFRPGMPAGSDLAVAGLTGAAGAALGWRLIGSIAEKPASPPATPPISRLLKEARPYWVLAIVVYCYSTLQIPLVGSLAGQRPLGIYRSALMLAGGLDLLYASLNNLLLPRLVRWRKDGIESFRRKQNQLFKISLTAGALVAVGTIAAAPVVYRTMLGPNFASGVLPFQILVLSRTVVFVGQIYSNSLVAFGLDKQFLWSSIAGALFSVTASIYAVLAHGIIGAAIVSLSSEIVVHGLCFMFTKIHYNGRGNSPGTAVNQGP